MNILYCGDRNIEKGLIVSILSLMRAVKEPLNVYVVTMELKTENKVYMPVSEKTICKLDNYMKLKNNSKGGNYEL